MTNINFTTPISFHLEAEDAPNFFSSYKRLTTWIDNELKLWEDLVNDWTSEENKPTAKEYPFNLGKQFHEISDNKRVIENWYNNNKEHANLDLDQFQKIINDLFARSIVTISLQSKKGTYILELYKQDRLLALSTLANWNQHIYGALDWLSPRPDNNQQKKRFALLHKGAACACNFEQGIKGNARTEKSLLNKKTQELEALLQQTANANENANQTLVEISENYDEFLNEKNGLSIKIEKDVKNKINEYEDLYRNKLANEASVKYWNSEATKHELSSKLWLTLLIAGIILSLIGMNKYFHEIPELLTENSKLEGIGAILLFSFPIFIAMWGLKILHAGYKLNLIKYHDARERAIMTQTYLSLLAEDRASENDRILILNALFRPSSSHSSNDDGAPVHWFDMLLERSRQSGN